MSFHDKSKTQQLEQELSIVSDALESSINGVIITDLAGLIEYVNPAFVRMFEYDGPETIIGTSAADIFTKRDIRNLSDVHKKIEEVEGETREFRVKRHDQSTFFVEVSASSVKDKKNQTVGWMAFFVDITERKWAEAQNRILNRRLMKSQELEQERISKDLHDSVAQTIHAAKLNFKAFEKNPEKHNDRFKAGLDFLDKASDELREVCNDLYPSMLKDHGLVPTLRWYIKHYLEVNGIQTEQNISLSRELSHDLQVSLYRMIREIFSNIVKHSGAKDVSIILKEQERGLAIRIKDSGCGFDLSEVQKQPGGYGISNITQRVQNLGGTLNIISSPGKGTEIRIRLDHKDEED